MLLVQISDIHCGPMFRKESLETAIREINKMCPDVVLITGDLTENGLMSEFDIASKELKKIQSKKGLSTLAEIMTTAPQVICSSKSIFRSHRLQKRKTL
jgi:3',5'-cyclic AMP phosphodiesterase CpdA